MAKELVENKNKISMPSRILVASIGVIGGIAIAGFRTASKKEWIIAAIIGGAVLFGVTYIVSPEKKLIDKKK